MLKREDLYLLRSMHLSPVTVKGLEQRFNPTGSQVECIVVENDGEYEEVEYEPGKAFGRDDKGRNH